MRFRKIIPSKLKTRKAADFLLFIGILVFLELCILPYNSFGYSDSETNEAEEIPSDLFSREYISVSGEIEIEGSYESFNFGDPSEKDFSNSDLSLSTVEIGLEVFVNRYMSGYVLFSYEDEEDAKIEVDEGFIELGWSDEHTYYLIVGHQDLPFGNFDTIFISDPLTQELGETKKTSIVGGLEADWLNLTVGFFNGDVDETSKENDHITNYVFSADTVFSTKNFGEFGFGISYINSIAESDTLLEEIITPDGTLPNLIGGYAACLLFEFDPVVISTQYVSAVEHFPSGSLSFDSGKSYQPSAFNLEGTVELTENLLMGVRYGVSKDGGDVFAEKIYGSAMEYSFIKSTLMGLEVQYMEYENHDKAMSVLARLALIF